MKCLNLEILARNGREIIGVATAMGYETVSDMIYIMRHEMRLSYRKIAKITGFDRSYIKKLSSVWEVQDGNGNGGSDIGYDWWGG